MNFESTGWIDLAFGHSPTFAWAIIRIDKVFDPEHSGTLIDPPKDLAAWIAAFPGLTVVAPPKAVKVGGLDAAQLDVVIGDKPVQFAPIPGVDDPAAGIELRRAARIITVSVDGHQVLIYFFADEEGTAHFDAAVAALQPLTDSIVWH